ncbi:MAG: flagellar hook protein FlgE [Methylocystis sp.]|nr:flagellar hook protein FlgE [Methylocystis sp.]
MTANALFNTSMMGMSAQTAALGSIAENISNSNTIGYKEVTTEFSSLLQSFEGGEAIGGVSTKTRFEIAAQGDLQSTSSSTDLGIQGSGFFVVSDSADQVFLTRAGSFVPDAEGRLVNAAGFYLMGFVAGNGGSPPASNSLSDMQIIRVNPGKLIANPSTSGELSANLQASAPIIAPADLPSTNTAGALFTSKTSLTAYDNFGNSITLDVYFANEGGNNWEMDVYNAADAASGGGFPYSSSALVTQTLAFNPANGNLLSGSPATVPIPGGANMTFDVSDLTQLGAPFTITSATINGNAAAAVSRIQIGSDGTLNYLLSNGQSVPAYKIGLANVNSPDNLDILPGGVFSPSVDSGQAFVGIAGTAGFGKIVSSELESSTVDLATQLSNMIVAQRAYTANTQVFQVASDVLQILNNLK